MISKISKIKLYVSMLIIAIMICTPLFSLTVNAEEGYFSPDYTYTVRIYSGGQGTFSDGSTMILIKATYGTKVSLVNTLDTIKMKQEKNLSGEMVDSKYYPKGIRESGKDNNTVNAIVGPVFTITRDADYVVAYAMKGGDVAYTVKYIDAETGKELAPTDTFYGNIGDKPVVAYKYIDGYIPKAYNLAKTLTDDENANVFVFEYKKSDGSGYYYYTEDGGIIYVDKEGETTVEHIPGKTIVVEGDRTGITILPDEPAPLAPVVADSNRTNSRTNNNNRDNSANNTNRDDDSNIADDDSDSDAIEEEDFSDTIIDESEVPLDVIDLDEPDPEVALNDGKFLSGSEEVSNATKLKVIIAIVTALAMGAVAGVFIIRMRANDRAKIFESISKKNSTKKDKKDTK